MEKELLAKVAARALQLNDPDLNILMLKLGLYDVPKAEVSDKIKQQESRKYKAPINTQKPYTYLNKVYQPDTPAGELKEGNIILSSEGIPSKVEKVLKVTKDYITILESLDFTSKKHKLQLERKIRISTKLVIL